MVPLYRTQFEFNMDSGNPRDSVVNTVHILADDEVELESGGIVAFTTFYGTLDAQFSALVDPAASVYRAYDLADPEPRAPVVEETWNLGTVAVTTAAPELAVCISFEAPQQSGVPQARRRGRFYLGPLYNPALNSSSGQVDNGVVDVIADAVQDLLDTSANATTWAWMVYSPTNSAAVEVLHAWVDNAVDIQRRRGLDPTYTVDLTPVFP